MTKILTQEGFDAWLPSSTGDPNRRLTEAELAECFPALVAVLNGEIEPRLNRQCPRCDAVLVEPGPCPDCRMVDRDVANAPRAADRDLIPPMLRPYRLSGEDYRVTQWIDQRDDCPLAWTPVPERGAGAMNLWLDRFPRSGAQWFAFEDLAAQIRSVSRTPERLDWIRRKHGLLVVTTLEAECWTGTVREGMGRILGHRAEHGLPTLVVCRAKAQSHEALMGARLAGLLEEARQV